MTISSKPGEGEVLPETRLGFVAPCPIDTREKLDNEMVLFFLAQIADRAHRCLGVESNEEMDKYILENNKYLRRFFYSAQMDNDPRAAGIMRFYNFCVQLGCANLLNFDLGYYHQSAEIVIKDLRNLIRLTMIAITNKIGNMPLMLEMQIPAISGGNEENLDLAEKIAERIMDITLRSKGGSTTEVISVLLVMRDCYKNQ